MSFKFAVIVPAKGPRKIPRFKEWAGKTVPNLSYSLPPQVPIEATALTVRVASVEDRDTLKSLFPDTLP